MATTIKAYLIEHYRNDLLNILNKPLEEKYVAINVDLRDLKNHNIEWFNAIMVNVNDEMKTWSEALIFAQESFVIEEVDDLDDNISIKRDAKVRFVYIPPSDQLQVLKPFPNRDDDVGKFREVSGTVVRMSNVKLIEMKREFFCPDCKNKIELDAEPSLKYKFDVPGKCPTEKCNGKLQKKNGDPIKEHSRNYQEIIIQEVSNQKAIPSSLVIILEYDLIDSCQPGNRIIAWGIAEREWESFNKNLRKAAIIFRAVSLICENNSLFQDIYFMSNRYISLKNQWIAHVKQYGAELDMRDFILRSICPEVYGFYPVKLAIALVLCTGSGNDTNELIGDTTRPNSHLLLIGDSGMAKSKLLLYASEIAPRAIHTTGAGSSSAGLTASTVWDGNDWNLDAGALVLADGGICCIDDFDLLKESEQNSILEAMEQQKISIAKAGIKCSLNTRCSVLAAANSKNQQTKTNQKELTNIGVGEALLSRFDLVLVLLDSTSNDEWDLKIADHILSQATTGFTGLSLFANRKLWTNEELQLHFSAVRQIQPRVTSNAAKLLNTYYLVCRSYVDRTKSRTTTRFIEALYRLAIGHARLCFRDEVTIVDACVIIRLMESGFGLGHIMRKPYDMVKQDLPLGPTDDEIKCILEKLGISEISNFLDSITPENCPDLTMDTEDFIVMREEIRDDLSTNNELNTLEEGVLLIQQHLEQSKSQPSLSSRILNLQKASKQIKRSNRLALNVKRCTPTALSHSRKTIAKSHSYIVPKQTKPKNRFFDPTTSDEEDSLIESKPLEVQLPRLFTVQPQLLNSRNLIQHQYRENRCNFRNYRLFGIVTHKGNTLGSGHYTARVLDDKSNGDFYEFDDEKPVQKVPFPYENDGYMFFLENMEIETRQIDIDSTIDVLHGRRMINLDSYSCYMIAILQVLFHNNSFRKSLRDVCHEHTNICTCVYCILKRTLHESRSSDHIDESFDPLEMRQKLTDISSNFTHGIQQDAQEFFQQLLFQNQDLNMLTSKWYMKKKEYVKCISCQTIFPLPNESVVENVLFVNIDEVGSLDEAVGLSFINQVDFEWTCGNCNYANTYREMIYQIEEFPKFLCITIKRFSPGIAKITKSIACQRILKLYEWQPQQQNTADDEMDLSFLETLEYTCDEF